MLSWASLLRCSGLLVLLLVVGCQPATRPSADRATDDASLFGPADLRIHPFTAIKDWTGDSRPDGVEALIELLDRMRDPTKATGTVLFELYVYRPDYPDPRGERLAAWRGSLLSLEDQRMHYNRISRTYSFQLACPDLRPGRSYVFEVTFEHGGKRLLGRVVLQPPQEPKVEPATQPTSRPSTRPATGPATSTPPARTPQP